MKFKKLLKQKRKPKHLKALNQDGYQFHFEEMAFTKPKRQYINVKELPKHTLFCECKQCTIKPKHYRKAFEND